MLTDGGQFQIPAGRDPGWRENVAVQAAITTVFTGVQAWAIVLAVLHVRVVGAERVALAVALAAAVLAVLDSWREVWSRARHTVRRRKVVWAAATADGLAGQYPAGPG